MSKTVNTLTSKILKMVMHSGDFMAQQVNHTKQNKTNYWILFDEKLSPYWVVTNTFTKPIQLKKNTIMTHIVVSECDVFAPHKNAEIQGQPIANLRFVTNQLSDKSYYKRINNIKTELAHIGINNNLFLRKKLGSQLLKLFEYQSFTLGATTAQGIATPKSDIISYTSLEHFYITNNYKVIGKRLSKRFDPSTIKDYAKNVLTLKYGNQNYKVVVPFNLKQDVKREIFKRYNTHCPNLEK